MSNAKSILATWTDEDGTGPDVVQIALEDFPSPEVAVALSQPELHRAVHLSIGHEPGETYVSNAGLMIGGALALDRAAAAELHRQLGAWLEVNRG